MNKKLKITLLFLTISIALGTAFWMYSLWQQEKFWGHLPLFFFLAVWLTWVLIWEKGFRKITGDWRLFGLSTLSGVLLSIAFPPIPLAILMFIAFVPILLIEKEISEKIEAPAKWEVFKYSYNAFIIWNILTTFWVANTAFAAAFIAFFLNAVFMTIPIVLFHQSKKYLKKNLAYSAFIAYWISFEYIHLRWEISWTWLNIGNSFASVPKWIQWYEYTGVFGGALWILLANVFVFLLLEKYNDRMSPSHFIKFLKEKNNTIALFKIAAWIVIPIIFSMLMYYNYEEKGATIEVVAVQPNFDPHYEKFKLPERVQLTRFLDLSKQQLTDSTDYLIFPETSFGGIRKDYLLNNRALKALYTFVNQYPNLKLVTGISAQKVFGKGDVHSPATKIHIDKTTGDTLFWESYNAAIQIESGVDDIPFYKKSMLVPGAEFLPYYKIFFFLKPIVDKFEGTMEGYGKQKKRSPFFSKGIGVAPVICYESIYGEYCTNYVRNGAQAIFIVTNDGWWDNTAGHKQHLLFARLRAIETRRSIARSANIGNCAFINQRGDISQATEYGKPAAIKGNIVLNNKVTTYVIYGDMIGRIALFLAVILLLNTFVKGITKKNEMILEG
ncbi:MAG TPA: apolipoprotein N-acyltransferase [Saprospiraceae bacterium]|nr:apolipoprotein N-acyltransferase [Saprospiraceae bacterium]